MNKRNHKVAVGLSGGVDSAVAAMLLRDRGYEVCGIHLQCWDYDYPGCTGDRDRADAVRISSNLGIKFEHLNFTQIYQEKVLDYFYRSYRQGLTPNPDIICNYTIKFGIFLEWALNAGFDFVGTGHYAILHKQDPSCVRLFQARDKSKDQSYFLYMLDQHQLSKALFPLGDMLKEDVRSLAREAGLEVYDKPDSTGICFIGNVDIREFLQEHLSPKKGSVILKNGKKVGWHEGVWFYTVGQRRGFTITDYVGIPLYVLDKNVEKNQLIVGPIKEAYRSNFMISGERWICDRPSFPLECSVRIRNLGHIVPALLNRGANESRVEVNSHEPLFGVAPGQSAVFYQGEEVLGGGVIV